MGLRLLEDPWVRPVLVRVQSGTGDSLPSRSTGPKKATLPARMSPGMPTQPKEFAISVAKRFGSLPVILPSSSPTDLVGSDVVGDLDEAAVEEDGAVRASREPMKVLLDRGVTPVGEEGPLALVLPCDTAGSQCQGVHLQRQACVQEGGQQGLQPLVDRSSRRHRAVPVEAGQVGCERHQEGRERPSHLGRRLRGTKSAGRCSS